VIDVDKSQKQTCRQNKKLTNQHFLNSVWMLCNNFEVHYFHFAHCRKPNVPSSFQVRKTNVHKQSLFLALSKDLSAVSAGGSEVIAASLDRQFHDFADLADFSAASLDSPVMLLVNKLSLKRDVTLLARRRVLPLVSYVAYASVTDYYRRRRQTTTDTNANNHY